MAQCPPLIIGDYPAPLTVRLMRGEPAGIVVPTVEDTLVAPVVEWATRAGALVATHALTLSGLDDDMHMLWTVALTADQVEALAAAATARVVETSPVRRVLSAGGVQWLTGWAGSCETRTAPLHVVGLPGPPGPGGSIDWQAGITALEGI